MPRKLGERLAEERTKRNWSLREVEKRTGIKNAHLWQIEKGQIERPEPSILWALAGLYELDLDELLRSAGHFSVGMESSHRFTSAALRAMEGLSATEQKRALEFIRELRQEREKKS